MNRYMPLMPSLHPILKTTRKYGMKKHWQLHGITVLPYTPLHLQRRHCNSLHPALHAHGQEALGGSAPKPFHNCKISLNFGRRSSTAALFLSTGGQFPFAASHEIDDMVCLFHRST